MCDIIDDIIDTIEDPIDHDYHDIIITILKLNWFIRLRNNNQTILPSSAPAPTPTQFH